MNGDYGLRQEMLGLWGSDGVVTVPNPPIADQLPPDVLRFISDVGLPRAVPAFDFHLLDPGTWNVVTLGGANRDAGLGDFWPMSRRPGDIAMGVDLASGRVFDLDLRGGTSPAFFNSSLPIFVRSLVKAESWRRARPDEPGLIDVDLVARDALERLDPEIVSYDTSIWPAYFVDLELYY